MAWTFEDKFNSDTKSTGDLNGQDGWTADTSWDVVTTSPYDGDQCITRVCEGDAPAGVSNYKSAVQTYTANTAGTVYFALKIDTTGGNARHELDLRAGALYASTGPIIFTSFQASGTKIIYTYSGGGFVEVATGLSSGTWYPVALEYDTATDQSRARVYSGGAWGSWTSYGTYFATISEVTNLTMGCDKGAAGTGGTLFMDTITPTDPAPASGPANVKTINGLAKASVKTLNGLAIASVKTINGLA